MPDCTSCVPPRPLGLNRMRCQRCGACEQCCGCKEGVDYGEFNAEELGLDPIIDRPKYDDAIAKRMIDNA